MKFTTLGWFALGQPGIAWNFLFIAGRKVGFGIKGSKKQRAPSPAL
jgi:hypothetical protein